MAMKSTGGSASYGGGAVATQPGSGPIIGGSLNYQGGDVSGMAGSSQLGPRCAPRTRVSCRAQGPSAAGAEFPWRGAAAAGSGSMMGKLRALANGTLLLLETRRLRREMVRLADGVRIMAAHTALDMLVSGY